MIEIKSKSQLRAFLSPLAVRGKLKLNMIDDMVRVVDLPEYVGNREGRVRKQLGGYRQNTRTGGIRKGIFR